MEHAYFDIATKSQEVGPVLFVYTANITSENSRPSVSCRYKGYNI